MEIVKNCSTCGHMEMKGFFIQTPFCLMSRRSCDKARAYPHTSGCGDHYEGWVSGNTVTVSIEDYEKMKVWEKLNG